MKAKGPPVFAIFGGTFNPVHEGHIGLVKGLLARGETDRVLVVPALRNPFKGGDGMLPAALRMAMLRAAMAPIAGATVLDLELRRGPPSFTVETVQALGSIFPGARLKLVVGWDVFLQFPQWRNAPALLELAGLLIVLRKGASPAPGSGKKGRLAGLPEEWRGRLKKEGDRVWLDEKGRTVLEFADFELPELSSSEIRRSRGLDGVPAAARGLLADFWRGEPFRE